MKVKEWLRIILGRRWAGLALTLIVALIGALASWLLPFLSLPLYGLAGLMLIGVFVSGIQGLGRPQAPGELHRINGVDVHILAQGDSKGNYPIIWVAGGHGEGLIMNHLHEALRTENRSILFDRTGSGWTGAARAPVTISGEVKQLKLLLERAGEQGPFVLAGHSFGGLFSANFAHHYPDLVAGVVLLDSTPPWNVAFAGPLSFNGILRKAWLGALCVHFGLKTLVEAEVDDLNSAMARELKDIVPVLNWHSVQPKSLLAEASVFASCMHNCFDLVVGKGALGEIPLVLMSANRTEAEDEELRMELRNMLELSELQTENLMQGLRDSEGQQVALSSAGRQVLMPEGSTHMFPYEYPERVLDEVRRMMRR